MTSVAVRRTTSTEIDWQVPITVSIAAAVAVIATVPLATMIARPIDGLVDAAPGSAGNALGLAFILMAPLGYVLFVTTAWASLRERADHAVLVHTMRTAGRGLIPFVVLSLVGIGWRAGPREALLMAAGLTIPIAALVTVWSSAHPPVED
jgi:hypothetical protein